MSMRWIALIVGFGLVACGGGDSDPDPAEQAEHLLSTHQRALDDARAVEGEMRERMERLEQAVEEALEEKDPY